MKQTVTVAAGARREVGGLPVDFSEDQLVDYIARTTGRPAAEVRAARRAGVEARKVPLTGDAELDRVRAAVEAALDGRPVRGLPSHGTPLHRRPSRTTTTATSTPPSAAAARAANYATNRRTRR